MNNATISGYIPQGTEGKSPIRVRTLDNGQMGIDFPLRVRRAYVRGEKAVYDYINCSYMVKAESKLLEYMHPGDSVIVNGRVQCDSYTNAKGERAYWNGVHVRELELIGSSSGANVTVIRGHLAKDAAVRSTNSTMVMEYTVAVRRNENKTDFIRCTSFAKDFSKLAPLMVKGLGVTVIGHIQTGSYEKDGQTIYTFSIIVDRLILENDKNQTRDSASASAAPKSTSTSSTSFTDGFEEMPEMDDDDDVPF